MIANWKLWTGIGFGVALLAAVGEAASDHGAPAGPPGGNATVGTGSTLQQRPIPPWNTISDAGKQSYVMTMQRELQSIGYGDSIPVDGNWNGTESAAALGHFLTGNRQGANAYGYTGGSNENADIVALMNAVDDIARGNLQAPQASDYVAPSSGLRPPVWPEVLRPSPPAAAAPARRLPPMLRPMPRSGRR